MLSPNLTTILDYLFSSRRFWSFLVGSHDTYIFAGFQNTSSFWAKLGCKASENTHPYRKQSEMQSILHSFGNYNWKKNKQWFSNQNAIKNCQFF